MKLLIQNCSHFADAMFKCNFCFARPLTHSGRVTHICVSKVTIIGSEWIFLNENIGISIKISLKFVPKVPISNIPALVQIMAWRRPGDKPLSEPMMVSLLTHISVTRPRWARCLDGLFNRLFRHRSKKASKLCVTGLCEGNPVVTGGFPSQRTSNAENVSICWRHLDAIHCV